MIPRYRDGAAVRDLLNISPQKGSGAPKSAEFMVSASPQQTRGGRLSARHKRRSFSAGPRFLSAHRRDTPSISQLLAGTL